jgi:hypothetical protein
MTDFLSEHAALGALAVVLLVALIFGVILAAWTKP